MQHIWWYVVIISGPYNLVILFNDASFPLEDSPLICQGEKQPFGGG